MENLFTALAGDYDAWYETPLGSYCERVEMQALERVLGPGEGADLLEVGAGTGRVAVHVAGLGWRVTAVEPCLAMVAAGRSSFRRFPWILARGEALPFGDGRYRSVLLFTVIEFVADPGRVLAEAWRVLLPGGRLVVGFLRPGTAWTALYRRQAAAGVAPWTAARFPTRETLERLLGQPSFRHAAAVYLPPETAEGFEAADRAAREAGCEPALEVVAWKKGT